MPYKKIYYLTFSLLVIFIPACGKRRPPVSPTNSRAVNQSQFSVFQQGNRIGLVIPIKNTERQYQKADVYRLAESSNSPLFLTEEEFASRSTLVGSVSLLTAIKENEAVFFDNISPSNQQRRLRYAVRFVNADNQRTQFSSFIFFEPISNTATAPELKDSKVTQNEILFTWEAPQINIDNSTPANIIGYNFYRKALAHEKPRRLNSSLLQQTSFSDNNFRFGETYEYFVRAISSGANGTQVESLDSNIIRISPKDVFPPAAPEGLTIAAAPGNLSIFFVVSAETDVIGYNIYRTTNREQPAEQWLKLNDLPITATTFQDAKIETGQRYFYYVVAVDNAGNVSQSSEIVSEVAP